ncbi:MULTISPECIES: hypothetical protein [Thalassospira]|uniref:von Hippel-Lindau disease tumour suppressor beta domain-containing protein n=1 Tax=Thalassospira aquimaris TaxID=3037796 RepID=A0ABT6GGR3_9PROT|nr:MULTISPECIES: hypothetical protein [Thalassospira]MDG4721272.1 hypothetical protein [Thalassospira sp. FZY0004]
MKGHDVGYRATVIGGIFAGLVISASHAAFAQQAGGFEQIPDTQSPVTFSTSIDGQTAFLRQYRDNSTVFVGRWFAPRTQNEPQNAASDLYLETVYTTSAPGFKFSTAMAPERLLEMFDTLKDRTSINGVNFVQDTRYGPVAMAPFIRQGSQCIAFVGQWDPQTQAQRGSRILGYYCTPARVQAQNGALSPQSFIPMIDAQEFAASFFGRMMIALPENAPATTEVAATGDVAPSAETGALPPSDGIAIITNWQGVRGTGKLLFDQPSGEGTMILDDAQRHCEGIWRHEGGAYETSTLPFGSWYVYCNDSSFARGYYTSESAASVTGDGQDNQGQAVYFRQNN